MMEEIIKEKQNIIFIDGSYFCFHRFYSVMSWWKSTHRLEEDSWKNPYENEIFRDKFKSIFINTIKEIANKVLIDKNETFCIIIGKDCKRENIWRTKLFPSYKSGRSKESSLMVRPFFKMVYDEEALFEKAGADLIISFDSLEADDCIAISTNFVKEKYPLKKIFIITSDKDYLQLSSTNVHLYNLSYNKLTDQKSCLGDPKLDLFCKIVVGDISDNIPSIFKKCGEKTAIKYFHNENLFQEKLKQENAEEKYKFNKLLIDFNQIPEQLLDGFILKYIL
jgi:5'-3' exonuclease